MNYASLFHWGPSHTPPLIRTLLISICSISIFAALTNGLFSYFIGIISPQTLLSLSWFGLERFMLWQPITYLFVQEGGFQGISFSFLFTLSLSLYFLWILGTSIYDRLGKKHFIYLFLLTGVIPGIAAIVMMSLTGNYSFLAGQVSILIGLLVVWTMFHLNTEIWLFFIVPISTRWLLYGILALFFLSSLSQLDLVSFTKYLAAALCGLFYGLFVLQLPSPFLFLDNIFGKTKKKKKTYDDSKIIDITGEPVMNDDIFVDEMLTKISKYGESSLTTAEKKRLDRISKARMKGH